MVENMFFLDIEHVELGEPLASPPKKSCLFVLYAWFLKIILLGSQSLYYKISRNSKDFV